MWYLRLEPLKAWASLQNGENKLVDGVLLFKGDGSKASQIVVITSDMDKARFNLRMIVYSLLPTGGL